VGLLLEVPTTTRPTRITLHASTPGARIQIRAPGQLSGSPLVGTTVATGADQQLLLPADAPRSLVIWITRLVPDPGAPGAFWAGIAEVSVWGVPNK
jgi:hypothetical protein